jgi:hypothetical protein
MLYQAAVRIRGRQRCTASATFGVLTPWRHHTLSGLGVSQSSTLRASKTASCWRVIVIASGLNPRVHTGVSSQPSSVSEACTSAHRHLPRTTTSGPVSVPVCRCLTWVLIQGTVPAHAPTPRVNFESRAQKPLVSGHIIALAPRRVAARCAALRSALRCRAGLLGVGNGAGARC